MSGRYPLNTVVAFRPCGDCQACCTVVGVAELAKPEHTRCMHQGPAGCAGYGERPASCRGYHCLWELGLLPGDERRRPDRLGVIFDLRGQPGQHVIQAWEVWPGALAEPAVHYLVQQLGRVAPVLERIYAA